MNTSVRWPKGYVGRGHETIGSDLLAVLGILNMPQQTLGASLHRRLREVRPDGWYPISLMFELLYTLEVSVGLEGLRQLGKKLFESSHEAYVKKTLASVEQILTGFDALYRRANRGEDIGSWSVLSLEPGFATLENTGPHHCALAEGIVHAALGAVFVRGTVTQLQCVRHGDDSCVFEVSSSVTDGRWGALRFGSGRGNGDVIDPPRLHSAIGEGARPGR
jgi:hypothetical protein